MPRSTSTAATAESLDGSTGGQGAAVTLTNAVSGTTAGGTLTLNQMADGGSGGNSNTGNAGPGGAGTSNLSLNDTTSAALNVLVLAVGGNGGYSDLLHGAGGGANSNAIITASFQTTVHTAQLTTTGDLKVGFYNGTDIGSGVTGVTVSIAGNGESVLPATTFTSGAAAASYFSDHAIDLGALAKPTVISHG